MDLTKHYNDFVLYLNNQNLRKQPINLYEPINYILHLGGKRIRPILTLIGCEVFSGSYKQALSAAMAIETFHNFTLVHDDIMDDAPLRRGQITVHEKWNINTGILSGDTMLILAYQYFENYEPIIFQKLAKLFSKTALEVCKGQQLDVDFETRDNVTIPEYIEMIRLKTSVLVGASLEMGAIVAKAEEKQKKILYNYGMNLGIAFQLQDDYLDTFGDPETFGKQVGGDILENKKTFLYLKALELAESNDKSNLIELYSSKQNNENNKIETIKTIFQKTNVPEFTKKMIKNYTEKAYASLKELNINQDFKQKLINFGNNLMDRSV